MPLKSPSHMSRCGYEVRGATLPRIGSGEGRGRRGSAGGQRTREGSVERREAQDKNRTPQGGKGSSKGRQHPGTYCNVVYFPYGLCIGTKKYKYENYNLLLLCGFYMSK